MVFHINDYSNPIQIRGFSASASGQAFNGLYALAPHYKAASEIYERLEVTKGPTALLNGMSPGGNLGGAVNLVPKRAGDTPLTRVTGSFNSDSQFGAHVDVGRRFGEEKRLGIRANGLYRNGDTFERDQSRHATLASLAIDYRGERFRVSADMFSQREDVDGPAYSRLSLPNSVGVPDADLLRRYSWGQPWEFADQKNQVAMMKGELDLSDSVTAFASLGRRYSDWKAVLSSTTVKDMVSGDATVGSGYQKQRQYATSGEVGVRAKLSTGAVEHQLVISGNGSKQESQQDFDRSGFNPGQSWNLYDQTVLPTPDFSAAINKDYIPRTALTKLYSIAIADTLSWADERAQLTVGVRRQTVDVDSWNMTTGAFTGSYNESAWTPSIAFLFRASEKISLYGNYIEGLTQGSTAPMTAANAGQVFPPYKTKQYEAGVKFDGGSFATTVGLYQIKRPSAYTDPETNIYAVDGEQRNRGLEINIFGEAAENTRLLGGLAFNDAKLSKTQGGANEGKRATSVPKFIAKLGVEHDLAAVKGLTLTGNITHTSSQYWNADNSISVPAWTRLDLGARYALTLWNYPVTLRATVNNVTDKAYWPGSIDVGVSDPRTYALSVSVDF